MRKSFRLCSCVAGKFASPYCLQCDSSSAQPLQVLLPVRSLTLRLCDEGREESIYRPEAADFEL